jgi:hypothetical protein
MKIIKAAVLMLAGQLLMIQQVFAQALGDECLPGQVCNGNHIVPEMDGSGAIIAIGLVVGLVALVREKFYRK